ncbi:MAG: chloride channel protein [Desulfovibrio sp.]|nr:chloride channel protein [Desulfovibrio sp.]
MRALATGLVTGAVIGFFRLACVEINGWIVSCLRSDFFNGPLSMALLLAVPALLAALSWLLLRHEPLCSGSGVPQTELALRGEISMRWGRVLWTKFLGTLISLSGGLSVGRAGPSIQMGAAAGLGVSRLWPGNGKTVGRCLAGGAAAGLAAAFGAPVAGLCFAIEEMQISSSPAMLLFIAVAAFSSLFAIDALFHFGYVFPFTALSALMWRQWWIVPVVGGIAGMFGVFYNSALIRGTLLLDRVRFLPRTARVSAPFFMSALLLCLYPQALVGFGPDALVLERLPMPLMSLLALLCVKVFFSCASFASGVSGGLIMPILLTGAIGGTLLATILFRLGAVAADQSATILVLSMAGLFSATVRAPLTATALLAETTGALVNIPAIFFTACMAAATANRFHSPPVFRSLRLRLRNALQHGRTSAIG